MKASSFVFPICCTLLLSHAIAVDSVVVFNEINYHPQDNGQGIEWVELHNQMAVDIDLSGWHIEDGINFTFAEGTIIRGGGYLVLAANPGALQAATGLSNVQGPFTGGLSNSGERLQLRDRNDRLMDNMIYSGGGEWPLAPDGSGATLAKRDQNTISNVPENWTSSVSIRGTPGTRNFPQTGTTVRPLITLNSTWRMEFSSMDLGTAWKEPAFDDSAWIGDSGAALTSYWPLNGNAAATRGSDGSLTGAVSPADDRLGTVGGALAFNGVDQLVSVPAGGGLNGAVSGTISLWAKWNSGFQDADCCGSFGAILSRQNNGVFSNNILALSTSNPATAKLVWKQNASGALITGTTNVGTAWRHIAVTFSPTGSTLYLGGVAQGTATGGALNSAAATPLTIGAWSGDGAGFMNGTLDDVAIWDQPLTAAQIAQLASSAKTPLDFGGSQNAVFFSGDGRLAANDELRRTQLPVGPSTYYFRRNFAFSDNPLQSSLKLDLAVNDGAVVYLNGSEVYRHNMPAGVPAYGTPASTAVGNAPLLSGIDLPTSRLVPGNNVLAVEVHQAASPDPGMVFGAALTATVIPPGAETAVPDHLVFNEIADAQANPFVIELVNRGPSPVELGGYVIRRSGTQPDFDSALPAGQLAPGGFILLNGLFPIANGDRLFLLRPGGKAVADAVQIQPFRRARWPDGTGPFLTPTNPSYGVANIVPLRNEIVFNEIMYSAPPTLETPASGGNPAVPYSQNPEQWIELHNRSTQAVSLAGWRISGGIDFPFTAGTSIPAGGYLVVSNDPAALQTKFPGLLARGPFSGKLSGSGETLVLRDANDNPADEVRYSDDGRWPEAADGGGSSLELRDHRADNSAGENWAASDETSRSTWQTYTYEGVAAASAVGPDTQWREFVLGLLDKGEVLLDDITVTEAPAGTPIAMLQNSAFTIDASKWRIIGNHSGTVIDDPDQPFNKVLRLVSTGSTDHMSNHAETTFASSRTAVNGRTYRISYRAKWISGCRQLNTRLYFNRLAKTTVLDGRSKFGTPGTANTAAIVNIGPTYSNLRHEPAVPAALAPVTVSVNAEDPDTVTSMTLWSRPDGSAWTSQPMVSDGAAVPRYSAILPGQTAGKIVQFYVEGTDSTNLKTTFPAAGPNSRALYKVNDGLAKANGLHNVRLVLMAAETTALHTNINLMSNQRLGATLIYDENEVFYNVGLRLKGSEHSRTETLRLGFNVGFNSDQLFRGVHRSIAIDRSESVGYGQREILMHQVANHCGGVPTKYHDLIHVLAPQPAHTGAAELQLARYTDVFLDDQYASGSDGTVYEYELVYQLNSTIPSGNPEGNKVPAADSVVGTSGIGNMGNDKEGYRWTFLMKNNEDRDDYSKLIPWAKWMATSGTTFTSQINNFLDVSQWLRGTAINVLSGAGDSYGGDGSQHNVQFYVRPSDGKVMFFPHDLDAFLDAARGIEPNPSITKIIAVPAYARLYYNHLLEIMDTTFNSTYMTRWAQHFSALIPTQPFATSHLTYITTRKNSITSAINGRVPTTTPFAITTNAGADTTTDTGNFTLSGTANLSIISILVNGVSYPITWAAVSGRPTGWSVSVPLASGANALTVQGVDRKGTAITTALDTITVTNTGSSAQQPVKINEWMASNTGPDGYSDPADGLFQDWIELYNPNTAAVDLSGFRLTDDLASPAKWTIPAGTSIPPLGFLVVWADNDLLQNTPGNGLHAAFQLSGNGETLGLFNPAGVLQHTIAFGPQNANVSEGLFPDGNLQGVQPMPNWTPRYPNTLAGPMKITEISHANGTTSLKWTTLPGRSYRVETNQDLSAPWKPLGPDLPGNGETATFTDPAATPAQRYYRVRRVE